MKILSRFPAKSISGSGDIDHGDKKPHPDLYMYSDFEFDLEGTKDGAGITMS